MVGWAQADVVSGKPNAHFSRRPGTWPAVRPGVRRRLKVRVLDRRSPPIPQWAGDRVGERRLSPAAGAGHDAADGAAHGSAGDELGDGAALVAAEREALITHRAGGQRVDDGARRSAAHRLLRGRARIVAVVAPAAGLDEDGLAIRRIRSVLRFGAAKTSIRMIVGMTAVSAGWRTARAWRMRLRFKRAPGGFAATGEKAVIDRSDALGQLDVLAAWSFGTLSLFKRDRLSFAKLVEGGLAAGLMEEVLAAVARRNEPEALVVNQPFDRAVCRSHVVSCQLEALTSRAPLIISTTGQMPGNFVRAAPPLSPDPG